MKTALAPDEHGHDSQPPPAGLMEAFEAYETALLTNDVAALDALFAPGPDTLRGDGTTLLVGHDAIAGFRAGRTVVPTRRVRQVQVRALAADLALVMAVTADPDTGGSGLQTQIWRRTHDAWRITAAHVTLPPKDRPAFDPSVWRVVGDPLLQPTGAGPLDGTTVAVKDLFALAGQRIGAGNPTWLDGQRPQTRTAPVVDALLAAGAEVTGIARTDEFAYSLAGRNAHYGTPPNPAVPGAVSGGSTSGPASAVALGQVMVGLGTDTAGSIRVPASYQGLVGVRTTHGAVTSGGMLPLAPTFDAVGWLTRDVSTSLRIARTLLPGSTGDAPRRTLALPAVERWAAPDVADACAARRSTAVREGVLPPLHEVALDPETLESWFRAFRTLQAREAWQAHGSWVTGNPGALGADVASRFGAAARITAAEAEDAAGTVDGARRELRALLADAVLVLPSSAGGAPATDASTDVVEAERAGTVRMTCLAGLAGAPAVSLPLLRTDDGRPVGLCLVGAPATDLGLLELAQRLAAPARAGDRA